ncbi:hypothetical protein DFH09DRAFT_1069316 [Mycena vulgaris]|nr:hypothetical protein DFH09DRAFT_1069316 [Mycena vulgaris]
MFLPSSIQTSILDQLLFISSHSDLQSLVEVWRHHRDHSAALYQVIIKIQIQIKEEREVAREARNTAARRKRAAKRKADALKDSSDEDDEKEDEDSDESDSSLPETIELPPRSTRSRRQGSAEPTGARPRTVLKTVTNLKRPRRAPAPQLSAAEAAQDYSRQYRSRERGRR